MFPAFPVGLAQESITTEKVQYHFMKTPWSEWDDADLVDTLEHAANSQFLSVPPEWKQFLPTAMVYKHYGW